MTAPPTPVTAWPKTYLLEIYRRAVEEGCLRVGDGQMTAAECRSLTQAFYRLRRRSDKQHASFILPEYHLVSVTYEPQRKAALFTYNALPDGAELPALSSVEDRQQSSQAPAYAEPEVALSFGPEQALEGAFDTDAFLQGLVDEAAAKITE